MEDFVLAGKAHQVFRILALREECEKKRAHLEKALSARVCPLDRSASCTKPKGKHCKEMRCPVWLNNEKEE